MKEARAVGPGLYVWQTQPKNPPNQQRGIHQNLRRLRNQNPAPEYPANSNQKPRIKRRSAKHN